ncbi:MAG: UDP-N-acetylmuramoyl-L-alanyl-D-glutamate--2,6-diaminopimelate ligase [Deltaproteobacteria bacterium]|nr:UDP-N-acetylmuramoyl-L-alanyl-D-glutamate--2,6-diaminopimelate ligase [Deltaproteobacteria bacterium]
MKLDRIISGLSITDRRGRMDVEIEDVVTDSRKAKPGVLFVALRGNRADGHEFIPSAIGRGASAVLAESWPDDLEASDKAQVVLVEDTRRALALAAANFAGQPSRKMLVAGVTGTNGKTTVTFMLDSIMRAAARKVGLIGTIECRFDGASFSLEHTTPEPVQLQGILKRMLDSGVSHVAMEVSSHALDQQRVAGIHFKVAGFTNLTQDHLDYHKTLEQYFSSKSKLFTEVLRKSRARGRIAVINVDDPRGAELVSLWGAKALRVSINPSVEGDVVALEATYTLEGTRARVKTPKGVWSLELPLVGAHNLSNAMVAIGMALAMGFSKARVVRGLSALERVPGRLEPVPNEEGKKVFVDYAHTPDALMRVLTTLRPLTKGRLVVVFGCGGDRDTDKRPKMGQVVAEHADFAILTSDNPRSEDPEKIATAVRQGLEAGGMRKTDAAVGPKTFMVELDRRNAIRTATRMVGKDDVLVIAGKGHERYQIIRDAMLRFDDREEAHRALAGLPPPPPEVLSKDEPEEEEPEVIAVKPVLEGEAEVSMDDIEEIVSAEPLVAESNISSAQIVEVFSTPPVASVPPGPAVQEPASILSQPLPGLGALPPIGAPIGALPPLPNGLPPLPPLSGLALPPLPPPPAPGPAPGPSPSPAPSPSPSAPATPAAPEDGRPPPKKDGDT